ncbi:MAG: hypothetical protein AB7K68_01525 [Bacteriovoracia bacterium]
MRNIQLFPKLGRVRIYQLRCALLLSFVPVVCTAALMGLLSFFAQMNLYFLENGGLIVSEVIRNAYQVQVQMALADVAWYLVALFGLTFLISFLLMGWAVSPFVNAEKLLRQKLKNKELDAKKNDWLSESPDFHRVIWGLAHQLKEKNFAFDKIKKPRYRFNYRFYLKFVLSFYLVSLATSHIVGIALNTVYVKVVSLAISLTRMNQKGHYYISQDDLMHLGANWMFGLSCVIYAIIGYYITRYMSNMLFVFNRAVAERHFPLKLRDSDIYHDLAEAISEVAEEGGLSRR